MAWAWLHYHAALRRTWKQGVQAPRVDWPVYPRRLERSTVGEGGIADGPSLSVAHDMSGLGSARFVRLSGPFGGFWMRRREAEEAVRMARFLKLLHRWEFAELNQEEAAELLGVSERTFRRWTRRLRGGRRSRALRPAARQGVGQAGPGRPGGGGRAALSRALPGLHGQALPRASDQGPRLWLGLHLAEAASSVGGRRAEGAAQGRPPQEARAASRCRG